MKKLELGDIVLVQGFVMLEGLNASEYYIVTKVKVKSYEFTRCNRYGTRLFKDRVGHNFKDIHPWLKEEENDIVDENVLYFRPKRSYIHDLIKIGFCQQKFYKASVWKCAVRAMHFLIDEKIVYHSEVWPGQFSTDLSLTNEDMQKMVDVVIKEWSPWTRESIKDTA